jgi:hypothetical protein
MEKLRKVTPYNTNKITGRLPEDYHLAMLGLARGWMIGREGAFTLTRKFGHANRDKKM